MKYVMHLKYDGHSVNGFATQPHRNTIEDITNDTLSMLLNEEIKITGSARTDSKVHSLDQVIMFEVNINLDCTDFKYRFNRVIKSFIYCFKMYEVDSDFHVRHNMVSKTYRYHLMKEYDPFKRMYAYYHPITVSSSLIETQLQQLEGTHNFKSFCASKSAIKNYERTINFTNVIETDREIIIEINADGFLYNMMRIIVGTLLDINDKKLSLNMSDIISCQDRTKAGKTAPGQGLFLYESIY